MAKDSVRGSPSRATPEPEERTEVLWSPATRIAFRFCFIYFGLYVLTTQLHVILANPVAEVPVPARETPMRPLVLWVGNHLLGVSPTLHDSQGSSDTLYDWTHAFTLLLLAAFGSVAWSLAARGTTSYPRLHSWFRLGLRMGLGTMMLAYGFQKVFLLQMPTRFLSRLIEPFGDFSPLSVLWTSVGAAPIYQRFLGFAEVFAGLLLLLPWTPLLGALVTLGVAAGVFAVNLSYDVDVKLRSFHLVLMSLVLIAPDARRLVDWFILNRPIAPAPTVRYGSSASSHRRWTIAQVVFAVWMVAFEIIGGGRAYKAVGPGAPQSPLSGIWVVDSMWIDGELRPPLTTDSLRYRHVVFQPDGPPITLQRMDQSFDYFAGDIDTLRRTITLTGGTDGAWRTVLAYERPSPTRLMLEGERAGRRVRMAMTQRDLNSFPLISRGFNWIQEVPFGR